MKRVFTGNFVRVDELVVGGAKRELVTTKNGSSSVAVLIVNERLGEAYFVKQSRPAAVTEDDPQGSVVEVCAGRIESYQNPTQAVILEVRQETGIEISQSNFVWLFGGEPMYVSPGVLDEVMYLAIAFLPNHAEIPRQVNFGVEGEGEFTTRVTVPLNQVLRTHFYDLKTQLLVSEYLRTHYSQP